MNKNPGEQHVSRMVSLTFSLSECLLPRMVHRLFICSLKHSATVNRRHLSIVIEIATDFSLEQSERRLGDTFQFG